MRYASGLLVVALLACGNEAGAEEKKKRIAAGIYVELDKEGKANAELTLKVTEVTPNMIEIRGRNGWVAYAAFDEGKGEYRGFFEWQKFGNQRNPGGKWADLYQIQVARDGAYIRINGKSKDNDFEMLGQAK